MIGFATAATTVGQLERAVAFAASARRFDVPTILLHRDLNITNYVRCFDRTVSLQTRPLVSQSPKSRFGELKKHLYTVTKEFDQCAFSVPDAIVVRDPRPMFAELAAYPVHTPAGRSVREGERWAAPPKFTTREFAGRLGVPEDRPIQTINGGFLIWRRCAEAEAFFQQLHALYEQFPGRVRERAGQNCDPNDALCLALAFARQGITLHKSDSSIGVWDARELVLDLDDGTFECVKGFHWEDHRFRPYIANFGPDAPSQTYRRCVEQLQGCLPIGLATFDKTAEFSGIPRPSATAGRQYDFSHWDHLPRVSCQCITYGRTTLLDEAVESFLRQDYPGEKELVILNDLPGFRLHCELPEVRIVNLPYRLRSVGEKRNACVALCTGEVVFPWDDDDISLPHRISYSLQQMRSHRYFKSHAFWYWKSGVLSEEPKHAIAHAMGCWSTDLFDKVGGYPHIQSGQDVALEELFKPYGREVEQTPVSDLYYIYRFPGTGSYHLSSSGYGKGFREAEQFVQRLDLQGDYHLNPHWAQDYCQLVAERVDALARTPSA